MDDDTGSSALEDCLNAMLLLEKVNQELEENCRSYSTVMEQLQECSMKLQSVLDKNPGRALAMQAKEDVINLIKIVEAIGQGGKRAAEEAVGVNSKKSKRDDMFVKIVKDTAREPTGDLTEIIGMDRIKNELRELIILPQSQPQLFDNISGGHIVLFFGPPGTGKTKMVQALAGEARIALHCASASDILSHYVGDTEKTIKMLFQYMKETYDKSILFIDEIDGLCRKRNDNEQEYSRRIKTELMCQITELESTDNMFLICATNCPWDLDSAILRRFQKCIFFPLPNRSERFKIIQHLSQNVLQGDEIEQILDKTVGFSGSDLFRLVQNAKRIPLHELHDTKIWKRSYDNYFEPIQDEEDFKNVICSSLKDLPPNTVKVRAVKIDDFLKAADQTRPSVPQDGIARYTKFNETGN